jgi:hypothetical protein
MQAIAGSNRQAIGRRPRESSAWSALKYNRQTNDGEPYKAQDSHEYIEQLVLPEFKNEQEEHEFGQA